MKADIDIRAEYRGEIVEGRVSVSADTQRTTVSVPVEGAPNMPLQMRQSSFGELSAAFALVHSVISAVESCITETKDDEQTP